VAIEIRRSLVFGLGQQGLDVARALEARLQRRHDGIPIVQSIVLLEEGSDSAGMPFVLSLALSEERAEALRNDPQVQTWLPDVGIPSLKCRSGARLALLDLRRDLERILQQVLDQKLLHIDSTRLMRERDLTIASPGTVTIDIYIVGNLGDTLVSGLFIDLAYLIRHVMDRQAADKYFFQINGVFLLPQLLNGAEAFPDDVMDKMRANTYAACKELDYYMDDHAYRMCYLDGYTVAFPARVPPFEPGYCYLVGPTNESIEAIDGGDAVNMTGEWLYHMLVAPVYTRLAANFNLSRYGASRTVGAYSSLGLSSLILPMRHVREYCARRLVRDLTAHYLLPASLGEDPERTRRDFHNCQVLRDTLRKEIIGEEKPNDSNYARPPQVYDGCSPLQYQDLEKRLIQDYNHSLGMILPDIKRRMEENCARLQKEVSDRLIAYIQHQIFDDDPEGAVDRARNFISHLLNEVAGRQKTLQDEIRKRERDREQHRQRIQKARGQYFNSAQAFGNLPLGPAILSVIAFLALFGYIYEVLAVNLGYATEAGILIGGSVIAVAAFTVLQIIRIGSTRANYIAQYNQRLLTHRHLEEARLEGHLLSVIEANAKDLQTQVRGFSQTMKELRDRIAEDQLTALPWEQLLYGHPYFSLEESVIDRRDVEQYYAEVFGPSPSDRKRHITTVFSDAYEGVYHTWLQQWVDRKLDVAAMWQRLYDYSRRQAERLARHYLVEKIEERFDKNQTRAAIEKVHKHAQPYLKTRIRADLGEGGDVPLQQSVAVHFSREEERDVNQGALAAKVLEEVQLTANIDDFGERDRLSIIAVRRGLPLYVLPDVLNCELAYRNVLNRGAVHTTRGNIALPDINGTQSLSWQDEELPFTLEPRQVCALAVAFTQFGLAPFDALQRRDASPTAQTPPEPAGYYQTYVDPRQQKIAASLNREPRSTVAYVGATKAEVCATFYAQPELLTCLREDVKVYLKQVEWSELGGKLYDYLEADRVVTPGATRALLEDWEVVELNHVLDVLLAYNHPPEPDVVAP